MSKTDYLLYSQTAANDRMQPSAVTNIVVVCDASDGSVHQCTAIAPIDRYKKYIKDEEILREVDINKIIFFQYTTGLAPKEDMRSQMATRKLNTDEIGRVEKALIWLGAERSYISQEARPPQNTPR